MPVCWNWQTRWTQNPLVATPCGFKSRHRQKIKEPFGVLLFFIGFATGLERGLSHPVRAAKHASVFPVDLIRCSHLLYHKNMYFEARLKTQASFAFQVLFIAYISLVFVSCISTTMITNIHNFLIICIKISHFGFAIIIRCSLVINKNYLDFF